MAVVKRAKLGARVSPWLAGVLAHKEPKQAAVALANKNARYAWKIMATGEAYDPAHEPHGPSRLAQAA
jgi:transposase